jgi:flagellar hook-associated protein 2
MAGTISTNTGLVSGSNWTDLINQMMDAQKTAKLNPLENSKTTYQGKLSAWQSFNTVLSNITNYLDVNNLDTDEGYKLFSSVLSSSDATVTPTSVLSASLASPGGPGKYAIEVISLAQAEKMTSDSFTSKTTPLTLAGDIIINGRTISLQASDTLTDVRNRINSANAGVTASILSISSTSHKLILESASQGAEGMSLKNGSGTDLLESLYLHTTSLQLAHPSGSDALSDIYSSKTDVIGTLLGLTAPQSGTIRIKGTDDVFKDVAVDFNADSLEAIAARINLDPPLGVTASVEEVISGDATTYRLKLAGVDASDLEDPDNMLETLGILEGGVKNVLRAGQDASLKVDGEAITATSNNVSGVIDGVTLSLLGTNVGKPLELSILQDNSAVSQKVSTLVQSINSALSFIKTQNTYSSSTNNPLMGDINLSTVRNTISSAIFAEVDGNTTYKTLSSLGITFGKDGTLSVNSGTLTGALAANREETLNALKSVSDTLYKQLNVFVDPYTGTLSSTKSSIDASIARIDKKIAEINERLERQRIVLEKKYNSLEVFISKSNLLKSWLTQQTDYMTGNSK